jgi:hypothetical protein
MIQVAGELADVPYRVVLTGDPRRPVQGSRQVAVLVEDAIEEGRMVLASPTGPLVKVAGKDTDSVLHLLARSGTLPSVTGQAPRVAAPLPAGAVA